MTYFGEQVVKFIFGGRNSGQNAEEREARVSEYHPTKGTRLISAADFGGCAEIVVAQDAASTST